MAGKDNKRITVTAPANELNKALKHSAGTTAAVVRSLKVANVIDEYREKGSKILVQGEDGSTVELQFV